MILMFADVRMYRYIPADYDIITLGFTLDSEPSIMSLTPKRVLPSEGDERFEEWYYKYILEYNDTFLDFMSIIYKLYQGRNVCVLVDYRFDEAYVTAITKIIAKRYGIIASAVLEPSDLDSVSETSFSKIGLRVLDSDKASMSYQLKAMEMNDPRLVASFKYHSLKSTMEPLFSVKSV